MAVPRELLQADDAGGRWKPGPAIAIWVVASVLAIVVYALVFLVARALGSSDETWHLHDATLVMPRASVSAMATLAGYSTQAYITGFYVRSVFAAVEKRWMRFSAVGAVVASALVYFASERSFANLQSGGQAAILDGSRANLTVVFLLAGLAAVGIGQALAVMASARRFLWWPFVVTGAGGVTRIVTASGVSLLAMRPVLMVIAVAVHGVLLGCAFVIMARPPKPT